MLRRMVVHLPTRRRAVLGFLCRVLLGRVQVVAAGGRRVLGESGQERYSKTLHVPGCETRPVLVRSQERSWSLQPLPCRFLTCGARRRPRPPLRRKSKWTSPTSSPRGWPCWQCQFQRCERKDWQCSLPRGRSFTGWWRAHQVRLSPCATMLGRSDS